MIEPKILLSGNNGFAIRLKVCPVCGKEGKMEKHHIIPKFLNPALNITITIHKACHLILNSAYNKHPNLTTKNTSKTFIEFRNNYDNLRNDFYERKLTRGQFGESLWNNLVTFLENGVELK